LWVSYSYSHHVLFNDVNQTKSNRENFHGVTSFQSHKDMEDSQDKQNIKYKLKLL
jgi:hypothetical protein